MPAAPPFDTLDYARKLEAAGVPSAQAELQARALNDALASAAVSRGDLANLENVIEARFANLESSLNAKIDHLESRFNAKVDALALKLGGKLETLTWMFGTLVVLNGAMLVQLYLRH